MGIEAGDTVRCVCKYTPSLTLGKLYKVGKTDERHIYVVSDAGVTFGFYRHRFELLPINYADWE
jgi:hypothetical protein